MFERIRKSISHPKYAFLYIKDKLSRVFLYILILTTIITLPTIIVGVFSPIKIIPDRNQVAQSLSEVSNDGVKIENNLLITPENYSRLVSIDIFHIGFSDMFYSDPGYFIIFKEDRVTTYLSAGNGLKIVGNETTYENLNIGDLEFNQSNNKQIANIITTSFAADNKIITSIIITAFFINLMDLLLLIVFLSILANLIRNLPIKFSDHFKINTYVATIYAASSLILILYGLTYLDIIPFIITYIYQIRAYRSIKIIKKVEVKQKDE